MHTWTSMGGGPPWRYAPAKGHVPDGARSQLRPRADPPPQRLRVPDRSLAVELDAARAGSFGGRTLVVPADAERPALPPELVQAAAWLATESPFIRDRVMAVAPLALLEGGDPQLSAGGERGARSCTGSSRGRRFARRDGRTLGDGPRAPGPTARSADWKSWRWSDRPGPIRDRQANATGEADCNGGHPLLQWLQPVTAGDRRAARWPRRRRPR